MTGREVVLGRIRAALPVMRNAAEPDPTAPPAATTYDAAELFVQRVADYRATVRRCSADAVGATVGGVLRPGARLVVPDGLPAEYLPDDTEILRDSTDAPLDAEALDDADAVLTTCALGIAVTGTLVLDHGAGQGRRAVTLVPDVHVCVVREDQLVDDVAEAVARLRPGGIHTWISGPSATSDIELHRVEGVHGPRTLHVVVVDR